MRNPANILEALQQDELDSRVAEALPWVLLNYSDLDSDYLLREARMRDLTKSAFSGFVVSLAMQVEKQRGRATSAVYQRLEELERLLEKSRLEAEYTFFRLLVCTPQDSNNGYGRIDPPRPRSGHVLMPPGDLSICSMFERQLKLDSPLGQVSVRNR